jgi:hypothetical protein
LDQHYDDTNQKKVKSTAASSGSLAEIFVGKYAVDCVYRGAAAREKVVGHNDSELLTITFKDQSVPLANLASLVSSISKLRPKYSLKRNCCYWFARAAMDVASDVFAADIDTISRGNKKMSGGAWYGFRYFEYTKEHRAQALYRGKMALWRNRRLKFAEDQRQRQDVHDEERLDSGDPEREKHAGDSGEGSGNAQGE